ncbi:MAG: hypothetical protein NZ773_15820 [Dehalococcoidia bacterium]|nr:hypothetical protein [Dehalococcoidia bacterium]
MRGPAFEQCKLDIAQIATGKLGIPLRSTMPFEGVVHHLDCQQAERTADGDRRRGGFYLPRIG